MRRLALLTVAALLLCLPGMSEAQSCDGCGIGYRPSSLSSSGGTLTGGIVLPTGGVATAPYIRFGSTGPGFFNIATTSVDYTDGTASQIRFSPNGLFLHRDVAVIWGSNGLNSPDTYLWRDAANTVAQKNANAPQFSRVYAGYGGFSELGTTSEEVTLATGGVTTDSTANLLPAGAIILGVTYRVTEAITTAVNFSIGDATTAARFVSGATGVALNSTGVGLLMQNPDVAAAAGPVQAAAAKVRITTNANPGAGKIRVQVHYRLFSAPSS